MVTTTFDDYDDDDEDYDDDDFDDSNSGEWQYVSCNLCCEPYTIPAEKDSFRCGRCGELNEV
jgi:hypothetical protein